MIILEGPDGSGKTTLALRLSRELGLPIAPKVVDSDTNPLVPDMRRWTDDNLNAGFQPIIFDRHRLISEPIYGTVLPFKQDTNPEFWDDIEWLAGAMGRFARINPIVVVCLPPYWDVLNHLIDDPNNNTVFDQTWAIYRAYQAYAARGLWSGEVHMIYNYVASSPSEAEPINHIKQVVQGRLKSMEML